MILLCGTVFLFILSLYILFRLVLVFVYLNISIFSQRACIFTSVFHYSVFIFPEALNLVVLVNVRRLRQKRTE